MGCSPGFGSTRRDERPIQTRCRCGSAYRSLNRATPGNSSVHTPKGTPSACAFDGWSACDFRVYFTPFARVLFTVPSRYYALSVVTDIEPWTVVGPASDGMSRVPSYLRSHPKGAHVSPTGLSPALAVCSKHVRLRSTLVTLLVVTHPPWWSRNPGRARLCSLARGRFRLVPVRSPLLREWFLFLGVREMFQFPRCPPHTLWIQVWVTRDEARGVAPFGNGRVAA